MGKKSKTFTVVGLVRSANKEARAVKTYVNAESEEEAEQKGKLKMEQQNGTQVQNIKAREPKVPVDPRPKRSSWW
ncbi:hypothetical protein [Kitasatospora sp. GP82]|uniref:hypothetical protein n=1 Tax=Kitasatospora sp. GP82 TaxID=3035089 RepID=UPI0024767FB1|nr:hypothetical protein [Kitasatospora sp. GP82]MDH6129608.1 tRNA threonylcarbamoyladenosine modification (KEOPS) complex Pcc1 subunit [Kitasatospora sp. GP82]